MVKDRGTPINEMDLSIVIPLSRGEQRWADLVEDLRRAELPAAATVYLVSPENVPLEPVDVHYKLVHLYSDREQRAYQLNLGARAAQTEFLWFVHADTRLSSRAVYAASRNLQKKKLSFFDLRFLADGPRRMQINRWGAWLRSRYLGMPFGDQGFLIDRDTFFELGAFDESAVYGEDHLFVWKARRGGVSIQCTKEPIWTSSRRYRENGWLRTTSSYLFRTYRQAIPQWVKWQRQQ